MAPQIKTLGRFEASWRMAAGSTGVGKLRPSALGDMGGRELSCRGWVEPQRAAHAGSSQPSEPFGVGPVLLAAADREGRAAWPGKANPRPRTQGTNLGERAMRVNKEPALARRRNAR
jgi:hypothetical protein